MFSICAFCASIVWSFRANSCCCFSANARRTRSSSCSVFGILFLRIYSFHFSNINTIDFSSNGSPRMMILPAFSLFYRHFPAAKNKCRLSSFLPNEALSAVRFSPPGKPFHLLVRDLFYTFWCFGPLKFHAVK